MQAVTFERYGPPDVLQLKEVPKPQPAEGELLIRVHAASVIVGDCEFRAFRFPLWFWLPLRLYAGLRRPRRINILGQELSGVVEAVGRTASGFKPGDAVIASTEIGLGAYAEYKCLPADRVVVHKPEGIDFAAAAALPTGGLNALHYVRKARIQPGESVLINGGAGNIGSFAIQLAVDMGATVTAVDSVDKLELMRDLGAARVIDYRAEDFTAGKDRYDVIFDAVGKAPYGRCLKTLHPGGRLLLANPGFLQMLRAPFSSWTGNRQVLFQFAPYRREDLVLLADMVAAGRLHVPIDRRYPLAQLPAAHRYVDTGAKAGHVVIEVDGK